MFGFIGIGSTLLLALLWAPSVSLDAFESPAGSADFLLARAGDVGGVHRLWRPVRGFRRLAVLAFTVGMEASRRRFKPAWRPAS